MKPRLIHEYSVIHFVMLRMFSQHCVTFKSLALPLILQFHGFISLTQLLNDWTVDIRHFLPVPVGQKIFNCALFCKKISTKQYFFLCFCRRSSNFCYFITASIVLHLLAKPSEAQSMPRFARQVSSCTEGKWKQLDISKMETT